MTLPTGARIFLATIIAAGTAILMVSLHAMVLFALAGFLFGRPWTARIVPALLGLTLVAIGARSGPQ